ncbi:hypothetical protein [Desulfamplus magnetovallimortis]|uniref:hypothetical protein n=1 Tax=Desulfamplus magnetovallimortis TaxID=1246637 RepID=UPI0009BC4435|nr:hypothetical protein [Desulfamplus magnetovallimortis]
MKIDSNPFFRRSITPWYDSDSACWGVIIFMLPILAFALAGLKTALTTPEFNPYIWLPSMLAGSSFFVIASITFRMIRRHRRG